MADMSVETEISNAQALAVLLSEHNGKDVIVLDLRKMNSWTDFFVIATVTSNTHLDGLERHIKDFCAGKDLEILKRSQRPAAEDDEWRLLDLGTIVIHLMSERLRSFYELERLYPPPLARHLIPAPKN